MSRDKHAGAAPNDIEQQPAGPVLARARAIRVMIFDVDGVLTDGRLFLGDDGQEYKAFNSRDGHGMRMLQASGVTLALLTGRRSQVVARRAADLGIEHVIQGRRDKLPAFEDLLTTLGLPPAAAAFVGDDLVDLPVIRRAGLGIAVADAAAEVRTHAHWVTARAGGQGAAREACELVMRAQGQYERLVATYLA
ncbi:3-deoxy-D-manno-octulosonate 8-phosphate phosphatase [Acidihalobacter prosperus]|uniref:3-deoxy-D-manno-octulosonate 8-phosphate phosphatase KdsC n=2 Tax=Acidihalobacter prosperus TaxID=160660 RepID=A0A1A6C3H0_9GAMM|nr:3-deoxy-D-manno-octulosonate 8-phosphate phosphatase [Acidihalobacter prosperus]